MAKYVYLETYRKKDNTYRTSTKEFDSFIEALDEFNYFCGGSKIGSCMVIDAESDVIIRQCISSYSDSPILK